MSYWTFTDIFEEAGPRFTPFHGGFGLLNTQGIKKPAFFVYSFLNKLGETEITDQDSSSWACKNKKGDVQVLLWDYTYTLPDSVNNQAYYVRDLPAKSKGEVELVISGMPSGKYRMEIYKTGYKVNDPYTTYLSFNKPAQLTKTEVDKLKKENNGAAIWHGDIIVNTSGRAFKKLPVRENDVAFINIVKL